MRVLLFLLLSLFMLPAFSADNLLRWHDAQHFTVQASTPLKAKRAWKLCALYPSLKDSYWLSLNYGMQEAARRYGVDLKVLEAGGYSQLATQQAQIDQCKQWGAEAILLGSSTTSFPDLQKQVASLPVIELVNAIDAPQVKSRVGVPWFQMGYQPGRYLVQWAHGKPLNVLLMPGPDNAGGSKEMVEGFRAAIAGSPVRIVDIALGDNDIEIQRNLLQEMLERHYEGSNFVHVQPLKTPAEMTATKLSCNDLRDTNQMEIFVFGDAEQILLCSRLDNLGKGASGAAVQCMNIMLGLDETVGLL